jgi:hypothetical protein
MGKQLLRSKTSEDGRFRAHREPQLWAKLVKNLGGRCCSLIGDARKG